MLRGVPKGASATSDKKDDTKSSQAMQKSTHMSPYIGGSGSGAHNKTRRHGNEKKGIALSVCTHTRHKAAGEEAPAPAPVAAPA